MAIIFHLCFMAKNCQKVQKGFNQLFPLTELSLREGIGLEVRGGGIHVPLRIDEKIERLSITFTSKGKREFVLTKFPFYLLFTFHYFSIN